MNSANPNPLPLAVAVCDGDIERVEELLDAGEPINKRDYKGRTALVLALLSSELNIARLLIERGADTNLHDQKGRLPLHLSLELEDFELAGLILDRGARPETKAKKGRTPLHLAAAAGDATLVTRLMKQMAPLETGDNHGATPLHHAAANNHPAAAQALLRGEPDLEIRNGSGQTALYSAVKHKAHDVAEVLVAAGADSGAHTHQGVTPLALAYRKKDYQAVELMEGPGTRARIEAGLAAATEHLIPEAYCEDLENRLESLRESIGPITNEPRFDVNRFLDVFDRVRLEPGYVLDYYHNHLDGHLDLASSCGQREEGARSKARNRLKNFLDIEELDANSSPRRLCDPDAQPYVFSRPADENRIEAIQAARDTYWRRPHLLNHLEFERTPEGLLQWVIFRTAVTQFHLCWHANYNDLQFILSLTGLERVMASLPLTRIKNKPLHRYSLEQLTHGAPFAEPERDKLRALDVTPWVKLAGDLGEVRALTFTKWGGFAWRHYHLRRPHHVDRVEVEPVVDYDCGMQF